MLCPKHAKLCHFLFCFCCCGLVLGGFCPAFPENRCYYQIVIVLTTVAVYANKLSEGETRVHSPNKVQLPGMQLIGPELLVLAFTAF